MEKVIIISIMGVFFIVLLKEHKASYGFLMTLAVCVILIFYILDYAEILLDGLWAFQYYFDNSGYYIKLILKMIGITYLCEFGTQLCKDVGQGAIAGQVEMFGKIMVLISGLPIVLAIMNQIISFEG